MSKYESVRWLTNEGYAVPKVFARIENLSLFLQAKTGVLELFKQVQNTPVIIRSDSPHEDSALSHAGFFDSYKINTESLGQLQSELKKISTQNENRCQSFFVQSFLEFQTSGVLFSRNPNCLWDKNGMLEWSSQAEQVTQGSSATETLYFNSALKTKYSPLIEIAQKVELQLQAPVDIEWGYDGQTFWLLQVRRIENEGKDLHFYERQWTRTTADERFPLPMTPLGWDLMENALPTNLQALETELGIRTPAELPTTLYKNYVYVDPEYFRFQKLKFHWKWFLKTGALFRLLLFFLRLPLLAFQRAPLGIAFLRSLYGPQVRQLIKGWPTTLPSARQRLEKIKEQISSQPASLQLFTDLETCCFDFFRNDILVYTLKSAYFEVLKESLNSSRLQNIFDTLDHPRKKMVQELNNYQQNPEATQWSELLSKYGHLRLDWDISRPNFREDPKLLLEYASSSLNQSPSSITVPLSDYEKEFAELILIDEEMHFYSSEFLDVCKTFLLKLAEEMGLAHDDVFYYHLPEIKDLLKGLTALSPHTLAARKIRFQKAGHEIPPLHLPPHFALQEKKANYMPVSQGSAEGPLHILKEWEDLPLVPTDCILSTPTPHPLLLTVYPRIRGLICKTGGPLSHGFISAREFQLPAISGVSPFSPQDNGRLIRIHSENGSYEWL